MYRVKSADPNQITTRLIGGHFGSFPKRSEDLAEESPRPRELISPVSLCWSFALSKQFLWIVYQIASTRGSQRPKKSQVPIQFASQNKDKIYDIVSSVPPVE